MILKTGAPTWDRVTYEAQRLIIGHYLAAAGGCVSCAALNLGLERTSLCRLKREFGYPPSQTGRRRRHRHPRPESEGLNV